MTPELFEVAVMLSKDNSDCSHDVERIIVSDRGEGNYRIESIPWFAWHIDRGDIIRVAFDAGEPTFERVVKRGGHVTYHVRLTEKIHTAELQPLLVKIIGAFEQMQIEIEFNGMHYFSVDVPPGKSPLFALDLLDVGEDAGLMEFESSASGYRWGTDAWTED